MGMMRAMGVVGDLPCPDDFRSFDRSGVSKFQYDVSWMDSSEWTEQVDLPDSR
jgi:hypothetical protein